MKTLIDIKKLALLGSIFLAAGCSDDFLNVTPQDSVVDANFYTTDEQVLAGTAPLYNTVWFQYNDKASYKLGDYRGGSVFDKHYQADNVKFNTTPTTLENGESWRSFFNVVGQANSAIVKINTYAGSDVSENIKRMAIGECHFMRALAYRYLVMNWGAVPIIENNIDLLGKPLSVKRNTVETVWQFITREYLKAAALLPESPVRDGRLTKWSAEAMLARTYLTRAGVESSGGLRKQEFLDSAKYYAQRVIQQSGYSLMGTYADLFIYPYDNNSESIFSLQWVYAPNEDGTGNSVVAQIAPNPSVGNGDGWGGGKGATYWMLSLYEGFDKIGQDSLEGTPIDQRIYSTFMLPGYRYPELAYEDGGEVVQEYSLPFNDGDVNYAHIRKYVVGRLPAAEASQQHVANDTYMMRLAEVYLIYAEAELGNAASTSDATALQYFNAVHQRATGQAVTSITSTDIFEERAKEFAMESMLWYDLVRLHYYNPNLAYEIISNQDRGLYAIRPDNEDNPTEWTVIRTEWDDERSYSANSGNFRLPLPAAEVSAAPNLLEDPVPYVFGE